MPKAGDPLSVLRILFVAFCFAIVSLGVVAVVLGDIAEGSAPTERSVALVVAVGLASLAAQAFVGRTLDCTSAKTLASSYRVPFFSRLAMSEIVGLIAFGVGIAWGPWWVYFIGAAFTLVGFARLAPTRRHLQQDQDRLSLGGCQFSLTAALRSRAT